MTAASARPLGRLAECHECSAPIVFARLDTGKAIPLDPLPNPAGNVAVLRVGHTLQGYVVSARRPFASPYVRAMPHHASCEALPRKPAPVPAPTLFDTTTEGDR